MNIEYMIDKINIKYVPEIISDFLHQNNIKKYYNLRNFYSGLLGFISEDVKESYTNRILKYLSSDKESIINIIEDFNEGIYDKELNEFCDELVGLIDSIEGKEKFYEKLNSSLNRLYFDYKGFVDVKEAHNRSDYSNFIYLLLKHAFEGYRYNTPCITAKRIYDQALTLYYNSDRRKQMIKKSSELGNVDATLLYCSYIYKENIDEAVSLYMTMKTNPIALWEIAYAIENNYISHSLVTKIKVDLKEMLVEDDYLSKFSLGEGYVTKNVLLAVKLYNYIVNKYRFTKAINSMGKILISGAVMYNNSREESIKLGKEYLYRGIKLGNVNSIINMGKFLYKSPDDSDYDLYMIEKYLSVSKDYGDVDGTRYYGELMMKDGNVNEAIECYKFAADNEDSLACYYLGKHYEAKSDFIESIKYYKNAISFSYYNAVYDLACLYYMLSNLYNDKIYEGMAKSLVEYYYDYLDDTYKKKCKKFLDK